MDSLKRYHFKVPLITLLCFICLWGCQTHLPAPVAPTYVEGQKTLRFASMGTVWTMHYLSPANASIQESDLEGLFQKTLAKYDSTFSDWNESSELRTLEKAGLSRAFSIKASPLFIEGLKYSLEASNLTQGLFDISIGSVVWLERLRPTGLTSLQINESENTFRFGVDPVRLSFGGLAKGMALGELAEKLLAGGIESFSINGGGGNEVYAGQLKQLSRDIIDLERGNNDLLFVSNSYSHQKSGNQEKQHIFDPRNPKATFRAQVTTVCSATVTDKLKRIGALSDAFSTALVVEEISIPKDLKCRHKRQTN